MKFGMKLKKDNINVILDAFEDAPPNIYFRIFKDMKKPLKIERAFSKKINSYIGLFEWPTSQHILNKTLKNNSSVT